MAGKYKRKIHRDKQGLVIRPPQEEESTILRESAEQIAHHEKITGISRTRYDELLHSRAAAHEEIMKTRNFDA